MLSLVARSRLAAALSVASIGLVSGCDSSPAQIGPDRAPAPAATTKGKVELIEVPAGTEPIGDIVRRERAKASASGRDVLVYVGASWCEPCQRFHAAAAAGLLDEAFPKLTLLDFDHDRDEQRLRDGGYTSKLIPLFAKPGDDGRASGKQIEGSIKGDGAVGEITPRLRALVESSR
jgi:thiol-disulfide isomerase/thioredoxin